ncbi:hypothetical protein Vretimale_16765 [Volvox reticuliferus]|uniref:Uncharacterized protein n=1 Tax=Volvox reticuliferus TaxID=1737510 RepID=A0A8J4GTT3_9CHLO|nr:hypothetical protein Vretimale_16765 [Volvox reticuliferus]
MRPLPSTRPLTCKAIPPSPPPPRRPHRAGAASERTGALEALTRLSESNYELVVVTSRQHVIQDATLRWLDRHYSGLFQEVYFGNHFALEGKSQRKSDICRTIGARVLIDDNPSYALECAAAGIHVLLYDWGGAYPWSKLPPHAGAYNPDLIRVVQDWGEVERELASLAQRLRATADNT